MIMHEPRQFVIYALYIFVPQSLDGLRYTKHTVVHSLIHYIYLNVLPSGDEFAMYSGSGDLC